MAAHRVAYYYSEDVGHHHYGPGHPMKPIRMKLAHHLVLAFGLYRKMECYVRPRCCRSSAGRGVTPLSPPLSPQRPHLASAEEMAVFHSDDYVDFLRRVTPESAKAFTAQMQKCACAGGAGRPVTRTPPQVAHPPCLALSQLRRVHRLPRVF